LKSEALIYVPSDTPEAMVLATRAVAGVPPIIRAVMTLKKSGLSAVTLLAEKSQKRKIERFLGRFKGDQLPKVSIICYDDPYRVSPVTLAEIVDSLDQRFFVINSNLLFDEHMSKRLANLPVHGHEFLSYKEGIHFLPFIDTTQQAFNTLTRYVEEAPRSIENCLHMLHTSLKAKVVQNTSSNVSFLMQRLRDRAVAEKFLAENIRHSTTGPVAKHLNKRISLPISLLLSKLWISPHAITAFNIIIGLLSGVFIADGHHYWTILVGATLYQAASVIDGCDGEVAKLTFRASRFGEFIDTISDNLSLVSLLVGIVGGYWRHSHSMSTFWIGGLLIGSFALTLGLMIRVMKKRSESASLVAFDKDYLQHLPQSYGKWLIKLIHTGKYLLKKDLVSLTVFLFALVGKAYWWFFAATLVAVSGALVLSYLAFKDTLAPRFSQAPAREKAASFSK